MTGTHGQMWYQKLRNTLETLGYVYTTLDHVVFVHQNGEYIAFHADDMLTMVRGLAELHG